MAAALLYKDRLLITLALLNEENNLWQPHADISWTADGVRHEHHISSDREFSTREEGLTYIEWVAKDWIDKQV